MDNVMQAKASVVANALAADWSPVDRLPTLGGCKV